MVIVQPNSTYNCRKQAISLIDPMMSAMAMLQQQSMISADAGEARPF